MRSSSSLFLLPGPAVLRVSGKLHGQGSSTPRRVPSFSTGSGLPQSSRRSRRSSQSPQRSPGRGEPARLSGKAVTADYFHVFSTQVQLGRTFTTEEDQPGATPVVVLSYATWQNHFGGDPVILGRRPILDGE